MGLQLISSNVVVSAQQFNPSITNQLWLTENGVLLRDECESGFVFTDAFAQVQTPAFHLLIVPDRCQFTLAPDCENQQELLIERIGKFVKLLPHTPYRAVGLNYIWHFVPENGTIEAFCRQLFFIKEKPLYQYFDVDNARFGSYLSKDSLSFRLKVDIKPVLFTPPSAEEVNLIQFSFNYHRDIATAVDKVSEIHQAFEQWNETRQESTSIMDIIVKGQ